MLYLLGGALFVGISLGLFGSGGSILTVPVLVYLLDHPEKIAIAESLGIVGGIALLGSIPHARRNLVDWRNVLFFGVPGMLGTYLGAWVSRFVSGGVQLVVFGGVVLVAAVMMMMRWSKLHQGPRKPRSVLHIGIDGLLVGVLTGFVGVGGGFLIVPALFLLGGLSMHLAVGTSLVIIALKSFTGFFKYNQILGDSGLAVDWATIGFFVVMGMVGTQLGHRIGQRLSPDRLRKSFAMVLVLVGIFIISKEVPALLGS